MAEKEKSDGLDSLVDGADAFYDGGSTNLSCSLIFNSAALETLLTRKMPFGSCFKARATALAFLCCCTVLITLPGPISALKSSHDTSITLQSNSKKQGHRKSVRDVYDDVRGTSSSAKAKDPLFNSLFWDEGIDVTRFHTCLKAELSRVMLDLSAEEEKKHKRDSF